MEKPKTNHITPEIKASKVKSQRRKSRGKVSPIRRKVRKIRAFIISPCSLNGGISIWKVTLIKRLNAIKSVK